MTILDLSPRVHVAHCFVCDRAMSYFDREEADLASRVHMRSRHHSTATYPLRVRAQVAQVAA